MTVRAALSPVNALALTTCCDYCGAEVDQWCQRRSRSTKEVTGRAAWLHAARTWRFHAAYQAGVRVGERWALEGIDYQLDPGNKWGAFMRGNLRTWADMRAVVAEQLAASKKWGAVQAQRVAAETGYDITE